MADAKRRRPFVYTTWITKLLSGEQSCWYAAWFKTNHRYEKTPDDDSFDRESWIAKHDALVNRREAELIGEGYTCRKEQAAEFIVNGSAADLSGRPDLVGIKGDTALVIDAKSGKPKQADHWQVLIYAFALPLTWLKGMKIIGEVERNHAHERERVRPLGAEEKDAIIKAMRKVSGAEAPQASPGPHECRYCDVASCPFRYKKPSGDAREMW